MIVKKNRNASRQEKIKARRTHWYRYYKKLKGCKQCGYNEHAEALCFAHIDPLTKADETKNSSSSGSGGISRLAGKVYKDKRKNREALTRLVEEIRKCEILCMNCHTVQTKERGEWTDTWEIHKAREIKKIIERDQNVENFLK